MRGKHRQVDAFQYVPRKSAEEEFAEPAPAVCAHHQQIGMQAASGFKNGLWSTSARWQHKTAIGIQFMPTKLLDDVVGTIQAFLLIAVFLVDA